MAEIGNYNNLEIVKELDFGIYLDGGDLGEILLPVRYVPPGISVGEMLEVFIYRDSEDRLIATTAEPKAVVNEFAVLEVTSVTKVGAFLDWDLPKDLLLPFREQKVDVKVGQKPVVFVYLDAESQRIVASTKIDKFINNIPANYSEGEQVNILVCDETDIGFKCIINNAHWGIIYKNEVFQKLSYGQHTKAYIKKIREDDKIDLSLQKTGWEATDEISQKILSYLKKNNGRLALTDKSSSEEISKVLEISKKSFKKAVGNLYKLRKISIEDSGIKLLKS